MNPLVEQFKKYGYLNEAIEKAVENRTRYFFKKKGEHFLREGQHLSSYFVLST
ncbi:MULTISPECIES: hypothetical protein [Sphingobacterium]|nr:MULTISPECIES: hypothetical protein [Sphingobacterium]